MNRSMKAITTVMLLVTVLFRIEPVLAEIDSKRAAEMEQEVNTLSYL